MCTAVRSTPAALRVFLERSIDYAGLFAPASLDMTSSVHNYSRYLRHPQGWALGRFVLPLARLDEFLSARQGADSGPWHLSAIVPSGVACDVVSDLVSDLAAVDAFNRLACGAVIDSVELRVSTPEEIELVRKHRPPDTTVFFELAPESADTLLPDDLLLTLGRVGGCAKLRTGGVTAEAFPSVETIAGFLARCSELGLPFKATAGLHHPLRCTRPFTYAADSPRGTMHGFLNLFTAATIAWEARQSGVPQPRAMLATCLADPERANWHFGDDALTWSGDRQPVRIELDTLREVRSNFALSFGSCSFEEPIQEMRELDLLGRWDL
jgi:hypothetical protein